MHATEDPRVCRACGHSNEPKAEMCAECGAKIEVPADPPDGRYIDDDPALRFVDSANRVEVDRFERMDEAELACGLLRSNGIACELTPPVIPGLPGEIIMWVYNKDAELAWALLADAEREAGDKADDQGVA